MVCMLQCEPLATAACCSCWGAEHGGERLSRRGGAWEVGKCGGVAQAGPTCACSRRRREHCSRCGHPDVGDPSRRPSASAAVSF
jgi:hypothetical protein